MNILIVSENLLNGGLETQINSIIETLKGNANFFFAFKNYDKKWNYSNVYTGFYFSFYNTVYQFCHDVDKLIEIINENHIDIIHVHPFYSFFPAVFAAKICGKPIVYTYHGILSYNFTSGINDTILFNMLLDYEIDKVFSVSMEGNEIFNNIMFDNSKSTFLPNSIDVNKFKKVKSCNNKIWALISRLDDDKLREIIKLLSYLDELDISELHIFGDGSAKASLQNYIAKENLKTTVIFEGYCDNLQEKLSSNFSGVFGIGRVAMESISMELPTILIGFNKIAGIIDTNIYNFIKSENFTNKYLPNISLDILKNQIEQVYNNNYDKTFYKSFKEEFSTDIISDLYFNELKNTTYSSLLNLDDLYKEIKTINNDDTFYNSFSIYNLIKKYFSFFIRQSYQKNLFIMGDNLLTQKFFNDNIANSVNTFISSLEHKIDEHEKKLDSISENNMTLKNFKRKLKYKFNKNPRV